jgi:putative membrane protein
VNTAILGPIVSSVLFAVVGLVIYIVGFIVLDRITPYALWKEICEKQNVALAILVGAGAIGLAMIISAAIHS